MDDIVKVISIFMRYSYNKFDCSKVLDEFVKNYQQ